MVQEKMTAQQAATFERYSEANAAILDEVAEERGCECIAYADWFTYKRWQALGMQVQKGEKGIALTTWIGYDKVDKATGETVHCTRPKKTYVFCRHQIAPKEKRT